MKTITIQTGKYLRYLVLRLLREIRKIKLDSKDLWVFLLRS